MMSGNNSSSMADFTILNKLGTFCSSFNRFLTEFYVNFVGFFLCVCAGTGAFSEVYKVIRKSDRKEYALKKVNLSLSSSPPRPKLDSNKMMISCLAYLNLIIVSPFRCV